MLTADTLAVVVGIEDYQAGKEWRLDGPALDACRFARWLTARGVPADRIILLVSPLPENAEAVEEQSQGYRVRAADHATIRDVFTRYLPSETSSLLILYWGGHGIIEKEERRLFYADATNGDPRNLNLSSLLKSMRSSTFAGHPQQLGLVDACLNLVTDLGWQGSMPNEEFREGRPEPSRDQRVLLAASPGERATNLDALKTGLFSRVLREALDALPAGTWPPDADGLRDFVNERFEQLRRTGSTLQVPSHLWFRSRSDDRLVFESRSASGRLLTEVTDPFDLEVHKAVQPDQPLPGLPELPPYVPREHDRDLADVVRAAAGGASRIAVLVGGSSTGKTRACWQALQLLHDQPEPWRLWHPIDPSPPQAALHELPSIGPHTVVWLNNAQFYLDVRADDAGERVAAGLRQLLRDPARGPVLVLATLWPQFWDALTARPEPGAADPHAQARELLAGRDISVPAAFTAAQLHDLTEAADPRLAQAAAASQDGQVTQFLAGAPELLARYRNAPPAPAALISAAMDARRLGMGIALPRAFLEAAAPEYLTDAEWDGLGENWLEQSLAYTAAPCKGIRGPLARMRPRPGHASGPASGSAYQLADYLDQHGRRARRSHLPPADFWTAATRFADPRDLGALAGAAEARGMLRDAARMLKRAAAQGDTAAAATLMLRLHSLHPADQRPARWAAEHTLDDPRAVTRLLRALQAAGASEQVAGALIRDFAAHVPLDDPDAVADLLHALLMAGADEQVAGLLARDTAAHPTPDNLSTAARLVGKLREAVDNARLLGKHGEPGEYEWAIRLLARYPLPHVPFDDPGAVADLLNTFRVVGAGGQVAGLLARDPAAHVPLDNPGAVAELLNTFRVVGAGGQVAGLLARDPAAHVTLHAPGAVIRLLDALWLVGAGEQVAGLLARDPLAHVALDDPDAVARLLDALLVYGAGEQVAAGLLARDPAAHVTFDDPFAVARMLDVLRVAGADEDFSVLASRAAARVTFDEPDAVAWLLCTLREAGADKDFSVLASRAAAHVTYDPGAVARMLDALREAGADADFRVLASRAAAHVILDDPGGIARLLDTLRVAGAGEQVAGLLARDPAAHVTPDDPDAVARMLDALREAGADEDFRVLASRAAAHAALDDPEPIAWLLDKLRAAGADESVRLLASRAAAHAALDDLDTVARLLYALRKAGEDEQVTVLARRAAAHVTFYDPDTATRLLYALWAASTDEDEDVRVLASRAAAHVTLDDPGAVARLLRTLREVGAGEQVGGLLARDPAAHVTLDDPGAVADLLRTLWEVGAGEQVAGLLARDPAAHAALEDPDTVARLLYELRKAGEDEQVTVLASRAAAHVTLDNSFAVARLLRTLREVGAGEQCIALVDRLPAEGMFELIRRQEGIDQTPYRFGCEGDGSAARPWGWDDLD